MVLVNKQDVIIARYRPERPERTVFLIVHWRLITEPLEVGPPMALPIQKRVAGIDVFERQGVNVRHRCFDEADLRIFVPKVFLFAPISTFSALICKCMGTTLDVVLISFVWIPPVALDFMDMRFSVLTSGIRADARSCRPSPRWFGPDIPDAKF